MKQNLKFDLLSTNNEDKLISKYTNENFDNLVHIYSSDPLKNKNSLQQKNGLIHQTFIIIESFIFS